MSDKELKCCVKNCLNYDNNFTATLYKFPAQRFQPIQREMWIAAIKKINGSNWEPSSKSKICDGHFVSGSPQPEQNEEDYYPTIFLGHTSQKSASLRCTPLSVKRFALEYLKYEALWEQPSDLNKDSEQRNSAYESLAQSLGISVAMTHTWEQRMKDFWKTWKARLPRQRKENIAKGIKWIIAPRWVILLDSKLRKRRRGVVGNLNDITIKERSDSGGNDAADEPAKTESSPDAVSTDAVVLRPRRLLRNRIKPNESDVKQSSHPVNFKNKSKHSTQSKLKRKVDKKASNQYNLPVATKPVSPGGVVQALCAASRARGVLCSTALYNDVKRALRLTTLVNGLHAVWVSAQRVSLEQVLCAARAGDRAGAAASHDALRVADLVLLFTGVEMHRLVTDESIQLYEESKALNFLWQLVQEHRLEDLDASVNQMAQRWTQAYHDYKDSGRLTSLVILQRRWYELKLQARDRLAAYWKRNEVPPPAAYSLLVDEAPPLELAPPLPRPAAIHLAILKRYPHIVTSPLPSWTNLVATGFVITELKKRQRKKKKNSFISKLLTDSSEADQDQSQDTEEVEMVADETTCERSDSEDIQVEQAEKSAGTSESEEHVDLPIIDIPSNSEDTDEENNLVIDEATVKLEEVEPKEITTDILFKADEHIDETMDETMDETKDETIDGTIDGTIDETIDLLKTIDPTEVKTEIVFDSDSDECENQPSEQDNEDTIPLDVKKKPTAHISDKIMFDDDDDYDMQAVKVERDVIDDCDVKPIVSDSARAPEPCAEDSRASPVIDAKLLMKSCVSLIKVDTTVAWKKYSRNNITINTSRIDTQLLTPIHKDMNVQNHHIRTYKRKSPKSINKEPINDEAYWQNIITTLFTEKSGDDDTVPEKKKKTDTYSLKDKGDDDEVLGVENNVQRRISPRNHGKRNSMNENNTDCIYNDTIPQNLSKQKDDNTKNTKYEADSDYTPDEHDVIRLKNGRYQVTRTIWETTKNNSCHSAASTLEWSKKYDPLFGDKRVAKKVELPNIEEVRRANRRILTAQVAPNTATTENQTGEGSSKTSVNRKRKKKATTGMLNEGMPTETQLEKVLAELSNVNAASNVLEAMHCCSARQNRVVNDARKRVGLDELYLHDHNGAACNCCCKHLCDEGVRYRMKEQLLELFNDITKMLSCERRSRKKKQDILCAEIKSKKTQKSKSKPESTPAKPTTLSTSAMTPVISQVKRLTTSTETSIQTKSTTPVKSTIPTESTTSTTSPNSTNLAKMTAPVTATKSDTPTKSTPAQFSQVMKTLPELINIATAANFACSNPSTLNKLPKSATDSSSASSSVNTALLPNSSSAAKLAKTNSCTSSSASAQSSSLDKICASTEATLINLSSAMPSKSDEGTTSAIVKPLSAKLSSTATPMPMTKPSLSTKAKDKTTEASTSTESVSSTKLFSITYSTRSAKSVSAKSKSAKLRLLDKRRRRSGKKFDKSPHNYQIPSIVHGSNGLEEWERQKKLNAQYFHFNTSEITTKCKKAAPNVNKEKVVTTPTTADVNPTCSTEHNIIISRSIKLEDVCVVVDNAEKNNELSRQADTDVAVVSSSKDEKIISLQNTIPSNEKPRDPFVSNLMLEVTPLTPKNQDQSNATTAYPKISVVPIANLVDKSKYSLIIPPENSVTVPEETEQDLPDVLPPEPEPVTKNTNNPESRMSILEQLSHVLKPNINNDIQNALNTLSLQIPGSNGKATTIIMAVTMPSKKRVKRPRPVVQMTAGAVVDLTFDSDPEETDVTQISGTTLAVAKVTSGPSSKEKSSSNDVIIINETSNDSRVYDVDQSDDSNDVVEVSTPSAPAPALSFVSEQIEPEKSDKKLVYLHKKNALTVSPAQMPCGSTLLCVDAAVRPLLAECLPLYLILTEEKSPCEIPTYWTMCTFSFIARVLVPKDFDKEIVRNKETNNSGNVVPSVSNTIGRTLGRGSAMPVLVRTCKCTTQDHNLRILTAVKTAEQCRSLVDSRASLSILNVRSGHWNNIFIAKSSDTGSYNVSVKSSVPRTIKINLENALNGLTFTSSLRDKRTFSW